MTPPRDDAAIHGLFDSYLAAYEAHDATACAAIYAPDAIAMSPWGTPVRGQKAIASEHATWFEENETDKTMTLVDLRIDGDLATCLIGFSAHVPADDGETVPSHGASLNTLCRDAEGNWRIQNQILLGLDAPLTEIIP
jgi:uncharacterized protein (TIGR02246 family)